MSERELVYGIDFTIAQCRFKRGRDYEHDKPRWRGRPRGSRNKNGYHRRGGLK